MNRQPRQKAIGAILLVVLLALALRLLLWSQPPHQPANDEVEYIAVARDLLAGQGWRFYDHYHWLRAPLYPLFLAASLWLAGGDLHWAALPNIALSVATVYLVYRLTIALVGWPERDRRAPVAAAGLTALLWTLATFASLYMAETLFTFLFTAGLLCLTRHSPRQQPGDRCSPVYPWWAAAAGVLFGLATLTRSITLVFLPVAAAWLCLQPPARAPSGSSPVPAHTGWRWLTPLALLLAAALTIAPWTIRNYVAYGRLIPVETGLAFNMWSFNEPREEQGTIFRVLEHIANPAERSDYAMAKGLARLREDPAILVRKLWPNWVYLWRVKPIEDRFLQENYYGDVGLPMFAAALVFDDALYLAIALSGVAGLARAQPRTKAEGRRPLNGRRSLVPGLLQALSDPTGLLIAWLLYVVVTVLLTHGEARYRQFLFPVLIPYAAWTLIQARRQRDRARGGGWPRSPLRLAIIVLWALIGGAALAAYPWGWAAHNLARGWHAAVADSAGALGWHAAALRADARALDVQATPDGWIRLGDHARAAGDTTRALRAYRAARSRVPSYVPAVARLGDLLRATGEARAARNAFTASNVDQQRLVDWSWRELRPEAPARLAVGDGLDAGLVGDVYAAEEQQGALARWTNGRGRLRLRATAQDGATQVIVRLRLAAPRPDSAPVTAQVCAREACVALRVGRTWRVYSVALEMAHDGPLLVAVQSDTFDAPDGRRLGVLIDSAEIAPANRLGPYAALRL